MASICASIGSPTSWIGRTKRSRSIARRASSNWRRSAYPRPCPSRTAWSSCANLPFPSSPSGIASLSTAGAPSAVVTLTTYAALPARNGGPTAIPHSLLERRERIRQRRHPPLALAPERDGLAPHELGDIDRHGHRMESRNPRMLAADNRETSRGTTWRGTSRPNRSSRRSSTGSRSSVVRRSSLSTSCSRTRCDRQIPAFVHSSSRSRTRSRRRASGRSSSTRSWAGPATGS